MRFIVDTNVAFSFFRKDSVVRSIILSPFVDLYAPKELFRELAKYKERVCEIAEIEIEEFDEDVALIAELVESVEKWEYEKELLNAQQLLSAHTKSDAPFVGLALHLNIPIWSQDKALKRENLVQVFSTEELVTMLTDE